MHDFSIFDIGSDALLAGEYSTEIYDNDKRWFYFLTVAFIYLPASNVVAAVFGPSITGLCGVVWGAVVAVISGHLSFCYPYTCGFGYNVYKQSRMFQATQQILLLLSILTFVLSLQNSKVKMKNLKNCNTYIKLFLFFPILFVASPVLFAIIRFAAVFKKTDKTIKAQKAMVSTGEVLMESAPQLGLQLFIVIYWLARDTQVGLNN